MVGVIKVKAGERFLLEPAEKTRTGLPWKKKTKKKERGKGRGVYSVEEKGCRPVGGGPAN